MTMRHLLFILCILAIWTPALPAQVYPNSPVFRNYRPSQEKQDRYEGLRTQINVFMLERDAANGDPLAQHELGVRYLTAKGVKADTGKSAEWLRLAASQGLISAMYNYALLRNNGWGVEWNPFDAYRLFLAAAEAGMPEAQYVVGIFHTDNLVLKQDWLRAYDWITLADEADYAPAAKAKEEILRKGHVQLQEDSSAVRPENTPPPEVTDDDATDWWPVLLDFNSAAKLSVITTRQLLGEFLSSVAMTQADSLAFMTLAGKDAPGDVLRRLHRMADYGNPEAMVLLGRLVEEGTLLKQDLVEAASMYATAVYLESGHAGRLLLDLVREPALRERIAREAYGSHPAAQYLWAVMHALELDGRLSSGQALDMLKRAATREHRKALVQLGLCFASGRWVEKDEERAAAFWKHAAELGDDEAQVRLAASTVLGRGTAMRMHSALAVCETAAAEGSILADVALAASYERGIGRSANKGIAVRMYRTCAVRGSHTAYRALRRMHEELRPDEALFRHSGR